MALATLRVYFRNLMMFVHDTRGTDVWFLENHPPMLITRTHSSDTSGGVVKFQSNGAELGGGETDVQDAGGIIDFKHLIKDFALHEGLARDAKIGKPFVGRAELRGAGKLSSPRSLHAFGALFEWSLPTFMFTGSHTQEMSELAIYEVKNLPTPITFSVTTGTCEPERVEIPVIGDVAHVLLLAGELSKLEDGDCGVSLDSTTGEMCIHEFKELHHCFDPETKKNELEGRMLPRTKAPKGFPVLHDAAAGGGQFSAYPYCPGGRVRRP
jgi:hypothetical protein